MNNEFLKWFEAEESLKDTIYSSTSSKINVTQAMGRISRASLEDRRPADQEIPDGPHKDTKHYLHQLSLSYKEALERINGLPDGFLDDLKSKTLIDKDLLQEIRDLLNNGADEYAECKALRDKLDKTYPFLC